METDRKSTRLNSSHVSSSYAVFCLKKKIESEPHIVEEHHLAPLGTRRLGQEQLAGIGDAIKRGVHIGKVQAHAGGKQGLAHLICLGERRLEQWPGAVGFAVSPHRQERLQLQKARVARAAWVEPRLVVFHPFLR